ncbi:MAG TPA: hypothetical protein VKE98_14390 [Gemmataceae bacterium]|nr:hypothetical protein [Gemmataceae bacterium]
MDLHALCVSISDQDLNQLAARHLRDQPVEDISFRVAADGIHIKGVYPLFINVSFETHWQLGVQAGKVTARLAGMRAFGAPGNVFKSAIMKFISDAAHKHDWLQIENDIIVADVDRLLLKNGLAVRTNITTIACQDGVLLIESNANG